MPEYPCVLIPQNIQRVQIGLSPLPLVTKTPIAPVESKTSQASIIVVGLSIIAVSLFIASFSTLLACAISVLSIAIIVSNAIIVHRSYASKKQEYDRTLYNYQHAVQSLKEQHSYYETENTPLLRLQKLLAYKQQALIQELMQAVPPDSRNSEVLLGRAEQFFCKYLRGCFDDKIHTHLALNIPNYDHPYTPDFTYIDSSINLFIDIEIDEPYAGNKPIHYVGADSRRNKFFLERGWVVIRFAEEQVIKHPKSCCREIARVVARITGDNTVLRKLARVADLKSVKQWTEREAQTMSLNSFRNTYSGGIKIPDLGKRLEESIPEIKSKTQRTEYLIWKYSNGEWHHVGNMCDQNLIDSDRNSDTQILPRGQRPK